MLEEFSMNYAPWLCWIFPFIGALAVLLTGGEENAKLKGVLASSFTLLAWIMALLMLPIGLRGKLYDINLAWISLPYGEPVKVGVLLDPLSAIIANVVTFVSFLVFVYSIKYMEHESEQTRYWGLMSLFVGGMLLLVLADNFILFLIGWKIVGFCSYALIGHYYSDERKYWIGGPPPYPFQKPSICGLKALLITTFGDVSMLAGILTIYIYAGTFNFVTLLSTTSRWMAKMAASPGLLTLTILLLLGGPIAKSAQFPLHTWLPEAMAGPTPVSALIHAATMVKAGVFIVARLFPIFYSGFWINGFREAYSFFLAIAVLGAVTAFLTAAEAMVALELKKILAYSTMSQIGYMMLGLGVAGMSAGATLIGYVGGIFHLLSHALFKAALFLAAGVIMHATGSIYIHEKALSRKDLPFTWLFMWLATLALAGVPPFSGFWSKDEILLACLDSGQYGLFLIGLLTAGVTAFYSIRVMGYVFHSKSIDAESEESREEALLLLIPLGTLSSLTLGIGSVGYSLSESLQELFKSYFLEIFKSPVINVANTSAQYSSVLTLLTSIAIILIGGIPAYSFYIAHKASAWKLVGRSIFLKAAHKLLWNRWYIDRFYELAFVRTFHIARPWTQEKVENIVDQLLNVGCPRLFASACSALRRLQTGVLSINMLYVLIFLTFTLLMIILVVI